MRQAKQRVVAIDYFRGICILAVLLNHASAFTWPYNLLAGGGMMWTSAAEMFFLLSGITLWVVRGSLVMSDFKKMLIKTWRRAAIIYVAYISVMVVSLLLALSFSDRGQPIHMPGILPTAAPVHLLFSILNLSYTIGWANFLMYYTVFLAAAPFVMRVLNSRWWPVVPVLSLSLFAAKGLGVLPASPYSWFAVWQVYFFVGLTAGRFRLPILGWFYGLKPAVSRRLGSAVIAGAGLVLGTRILWTHHIYHWAVSARQAGWLPRPLYHAYVYIFNHQTAMAYWLENNRAGLARPAVAGLTLAAGYVLYQRYKNFWLAHTGRFVTAMGRDTMWIFMSQALIIPLMVSLSLPHGNLPYDSALTGFLVAAAWLITKRHNLTAAAGRYFDGLRDSFYEAKYAAMYRQQDQA